MVYYIPGEAIALATFPGVIIHEIAHRFFCEINDIPVFAIRYFVPFAKTAGCVYHAPTNKLRHSLLIGIAPLILNSLVCILLTIPFATIQGMGTYFVTTSHSFLYVFLAWIGYSAGINAFPSNQDMRGAVAIAAQRGLITRMMINFFALIVKAMNINGIGFFINAAYAIALSAIVPSFIFRIIAH